MSLSTDSFAAEILRNVLSRIDARNRQGHGPYLVSHAWTDGPAIRIVYSAPPSGRTWGLARDTRESIIDPGPWPDAEEAALYYVLLDFDENQPNTTAHTSDDPEAISWFGAPTDGLPHRVSEIPDEYRMTPHQSRDDTVAGPDNPLPMEARRYADRPTDEERRDLSP